MAIVLSTNLSAESILRILEQNAEGQRKIAESLASGKRIQQAGDAPADFILSEKMRMRIRSLVQAERNANDAISLTQVAEGGLTEVSNILIRLRELAIQSASDTVDQRDRELIQTEANAWVSELNRIALSTQFNQIQLLNGGDSQTELRFQIGVHNQVHDQVSLDLTNHDVRTDRLDLSSLSLASSDEARSALSSVDSAISRVASQRATLGALQGQLHSVVRQLSLYRDTLSEAQSRIRDTDYAQSVSDWMKSQMIQSAGVSVLAQANLEPQIVLRLLQNPS